MSQFFKNLIKHFAQEIFHYLGYNNALSTFSEFFFTAITKLPLKYTKEILKNTKENTGQWDFSFVTPYKINIVDVG